MHGRCRAFTTTITYSAAHSNLLARLENIDFTTLHESKSGITDAKNSLSFKLPTFAKRCSCSVLRSSYRVNNALQRLNNRVLSVELCVTPVTIAHGSAQQHHHTTRAMRVVFSAWGWLNPAQSNLGLTDPRACVARHDGPTRQNVLNSHYHSTSS